MMTMNSLVKIILVPIWLVLLTNLLYADHAHDVAKASDAYNAGDYKTAVHIWGELAAEGDSQAQEMLAAMYVMGKGTDKDLQKAAHWYRMAADQGSASAQFTLAGMYLDGRGVAKSLENAYALMLISANSGNLSAKKKAGEILAVMTPSQIDKAKDITFEFMQKIAR